MKNLVIVESPSKTKKIASFLGKDFEVVSSVGHIRDLPKSALGVDVEKDYAPDYLVSVGKEDVVKDLRKKAKDSTAIYLATDEDREGESISWHVGFIVNKDKYLKDSDENYQIADNIKNKEGEHPKVYRVTFNSITKDAVLDGFKNARKIDQNLVNAQQARRILDRLVGYKLSPVLWEKIRYGLSAGRVQSVAVRFIVEREREIKNFASAPYFEIDAKFKCTSGELETHLKKIDDKSIYTKKDFKLFAGDYSTYITNIENEEKAKLIESDSANLDFYVSKVQKKATKSHPSAPFSTSSMQQSASTNLGYTPQRTMQLAQKLYEGGFITYMRTDSIHIAPAIVENIRSYVGKKFGKEYLNSSTRVFTPKKEVKTQEAHEAIRPSDITFLPNNLPKSLNEQQRKLYELIWARTIATQMPPAIFENAVIQVDSKGGKNKFTFEATGSIKKFDGYTVVLKSSKKDIFLPPLKEGEKANLIKMTLLPNKMTPPPRYNESSLVKALENFNIGRPSTYASIVSTIQSRGYVKKEEKNLWSTDNGFVVNDLLVNHFGKIVDVNFTSNMEDDLDEIAIGKKDWVKVLDAFYPDFSDLVQKKKKEIKKEDVVIMEKTDQECPECKIGKLDVKLGKYGKFYSCNRFPECMFMKSVETEGDTEGSSESEEALVECPECKGKLLYKVGKFGKFIACENYPKCKYTQQVLNKIGVKCPDCGDEHGGEIIARKTKKGRLFYGCSRYPACKYASWKKPVAEDGSSQTEEKDSE
jgi:DNA topoisomerase I